MPYVNLTIIFPIANTIGRIDYLLERFEKVLWVGDQCLRRFVEEVVDARAKVGEEGDGAAEDVNVADHLQEDILENKSEGNEKRKEK